MKELIIVSKYTKSPSTDSQYPNLGWSYKHFQLVNEKRLLIK